MKRSRGFTLVEFMVALTGGLFVTIAVFVLAKHASRFYQRQTHVANATMAGVIGFERLRNDIARAGFLASPNIRKDPRVCGAPATDGTWPAYLERLASVYIENVPTAQLPDVLADNARAPQRIVLSGSYASVEQFDARSIDRVAAGYEVRLNPNSGAMVRLGYDPTGDASELKAVFQPGRALRIVDKDSGEHQYGEISNVIGGAEPRIMLKGSSPNLQWRETSPYRCGFKSLQVGALVNVVNIIRYDVRSLDGMSRYAPVYDGEGPTYEDSRTELIREEIDVHGDPIAGTQELIAEYTVDLRFSLTVAPSPSTALLSVPDGSLDNWAGDPTKLTGNTGPQLIRAVRTWLSVRSREADRSGGIDTEANTPLYRIGLGPGGAAPFARVRTLQAQIALRNQMGVTWQ